MVLPNRIKAWDQSNTQYVKAVPTILEEWMEPRRYKSPKKATIPMVASYDAEMDLSPASDKQH